MRRNLIMKRSFNVIGAGAMMDVVLDGRKVEMLASVGEAKIIIDSSEHVLRFVPSNGIGPRTEVLIPSGEKDIRVTVKIKPGLLKNKLETEMEILESSQNSAVLSAGSQNQAEKKGLLGFVQKKHNNAIEAKELKLHKTYELEQRIKNSIILTQAILKVEEMIKENPEEYDWILYRNVGDLGDIDNGLRYVRMDNKSIGFYWNYLEKMNGESILKTPQSTGIDLQKSGYDPIKQIEIDGVSFGREQVLDIFINELKNRFQEAFPETESIGYVTYKHNYAEFKYRAAERELMRGF